MKRLLLLAAIAACLAVPAKAAEPEPKFFNPSQEEAIRRIVREEIASAASVAAVAPTKLAPTYAAPAGDGWTWTGANWSRPMVAPVAAPSFPTPIRSAVYQTFAPRTCSGGNCPR
jgi:hypothetical protein